MRKKILLIGGSGYIGLKLARKLLELSFEVTIFAKGTENLNLDFLKKAEIIKGDIRNLENIKKAVKGKDCVVNLASIINKFGNINNIIADVEVNCKGQINVLESLRQSNRKAKHIFMGSRAEFGRVNEKDLPIAEDYPKNPTSLYGIHKQTAEGYCGFYGKAHSIKSIILRPVGVYGPGETLNKDSVIDIFIRKALNDEEFLIYGYGKDMKDFLYIDDLINLFIILINSDINEGTFNVGSGKGMTFSKIGEKIIKICKKGKFKNVDFPEENKKFEMGGFVADISRVKKATGWTPKFGIEKGIKAAADYYAKLGR